MDKQDAIERLAAAGATKIEVRPDGTVVAEFGKAQEMPLPYPVYPYHAALPCPSWPYDTWWGEAPNRVPVDITPKFTCGSD